MFVNLVPDTFHLHHAEQTIRRFCNQVKAEHAAFLAYISGTGNVSEAAWSQYVSLLFNRLIAAYFLQAKGIFHGNPHYLSDLLQQTQKEQGKNIFYQHVLLPLFHECLGATTCSQYVIEQHGNIPALNLSLFTQHHQEKQMADVQIPDDALSRLFELFDTYQWQLDRSAENALHPDVLAYVFEQQINQKQMGAYYTGGDVTGYICRNTLLAHLFETVATQDPTALSAEADTWQLLRSHPERYLSSTLQTPHPLPLETEREYRMRRARSTQLHTMLQTGKLHTVHEFITYNLNLHQFALDMIARCQQPELLLAVYTQLEQMTILDPTCGPGAFLLTTLHILETLYTACLERIQTMEDDRFRPILQRMEAQPNRAYFILKTILNQNLHGVDVMEEAIDICKLRLFLALLATGEANNDIQPLPALDANMRVGNAVVGFLRPEEVPTVFSPLTQAGRQTETPSLEKLDQLLAMNYAIAPDDDQPGYEKSLEHWKDSHKPFHWFLEFRSIMERGGFDVIIGNPPYVEYSQVRQRYQACGYETASCGNLYAAVIERSLALCRSEHSYLGLIAPLSLCGSERFSQLRSSIIQNTAFRWLSNFEIFPCRLFDGAYQRLSILLARHSTIPSTILGTIAPGSTTFVTRIQRWYAAERPYLMDQITYTATLCTIKPTYNKAVRKPQVFPKLATPLQEVILEKVQGRAKGNCIAHVLQGHPTDYFVYYQEATNYWTKAVCRVPFYKKNGVVMEPPHGRFLYLPDEQTARTIMALMNSSLFYLWFASFSDGFHLSHTLVKEFPLDNDLYQVGELHQLSEQLEADIQAHAHITTRNTRPGSRQRKATLLIELEEYHMSCSKPLLDRIDSILANYYSLTHEELDFIIHYYSKYRMGRAGSQ
jgi:hypothetical protein